MYLPSLDISIRVNVRVDLVWHAIIDPAVRAKWWPELEFEPAEGNVVRAEAARPGKKKPRRVRGHITRLDVDRHELKMRWITKRGGFETTAHVLVSDAKHLCKVRVVESGFPRDEYAEQIVAECRDGWREKLADLAEFLDSGENVRAVERSFRKRRGRR